MYLSLCLIKSCITLRTTLRSSIWCKQFIFLSDFSHSQDFSDIVKVKHVTNTSCRNEPYFHTFSWAIEIYSNELILPVFLNQKLKVEEEMARRKQFQAQNDLLKKKLELSTSEREFEEAVKWVNPFLKHMRRHHVRDYNYSVSTHSIVLEYQHDRPCYRCLNFVLCTDHLWGLILYIKIL